MTERYCFKIDKLIRDLVPGIMRSRGVSVFERSMKEDEHIQRLKDKLLEETQEVIEAKTLDEVSEELADLLEVIFALGKEYNLSMEQIETKRLVKKQQNGGFDNRIYSSHIEMSSDNKDISYFLARPEKYPEIKPSDTK
ncbi:nucleoside triphosphate pyrophosphohydrolase [Candidatus Tisiphia endosymbiont of Ptychoptera albimana]|uniref:nucleoside triphosphate pyrophosphohydrolase n=1 Tax=Candidatus Tisiphia endosymbiont of Ptychoptera albimana TaxID=3066260 RepID=UPI001DC5323A|nr:nucleoside triphosphate pyrophosphohydrolase [Rickettsia endosymbiont of Sericostoma sp. HW-2014]